MPLNVLHPWQSRFLCEIQIFLVCRAGKVRKVWFLVRFSERMLSVDCVEVRVLQGCRGVRGLLPQDGQRCLLGRRPEGPAHLRHQHGRQQATTAPSS